MPQRVAGLRAWRKLGRRVRKGERALRISAPIVLRRRGEDGEETAEWRVFKTAFVFELSQTEPLLGAKCQVELSCEPMNGDSHAYLLVPVRSFVESLGYSVSFTTLSGGSRGWEHRGEAGWVRERALTRVRVVEGDSVHGVPRGDLRAKGRLARLARAFHRDDTRVKQRFLYATFGMAGYFLPGQSRISLLGIS